VVCGVSRFVYGVRYVVCDVWCLLCVCVCLYVCLYLCLSVCLFFIMCVRVCLCSFGGFHIRVCVGVSVCFFLGDTDLIHSRVFFVISLSFYML